MTMFCGDGHSLTWQVWSLILRMTRIVVQLAWSFSSLVPPVLHMLRILHQVRARQTFTSKLKELNSAARSVLACV